MELVKKVKIIDLQPILGADRIERATVLGWSVVVQKGLHQIGDDVLFVFPDTLIPKKFLDSSYVGDEKVRLKTVKMKGQFSAGLILPLSELGDYAGDDIAAHLNIEKYESPIPACLAGNALGAFPTHIVHKTDEDNYRSNMGAVEEMLNDPRFENEEFILTLKLDGTSATYIHNEQTVNKNAFRVCSRNLELADTEGNTHWEIAKAYDMYNNMVKHNLFAAIQGEIVGNGIQSNPMKINGRQFFVFLAKNTLTGNWYNWDEIVEISTKLNIPTVPLVARFKRSELPSMAELQELVNGLKYPNAGYAEGAVLRTVNPVRSLVLEKEWWSVKIMNEPYDTKK